MIDSTFAAAAGQTGLPFYSRELTAVPGLDADERADRAADRALIEAVAGALRGTGHPPLRNIEVEICRGIVVLWGRVATYHMKQLAQATAQKVTGVCAIANGIEVVCSRPRAVD